MVLNHSVILLIHSAVLVLATFLCSMIVSYVMNRTIDKSYLNHWVILLLQASCLPIQAMVWQFGFLGIYFRLCKDYDFLIFKGMESLQQLAFVVPLLWALVRFKSNVENVFIQKSKIKKNNIDPTLVSVLAKVFTVILTIVGVLTILNIVGVPLQSVMVFGGAISIAVGFAAQNVIANFFGGLMVYVNRPFRVGDWISSPDKSLEGFVEDVGWYSTRIRTLDRRPLYVPNSLFAQIIVKNSSRMYNRRIKTTIGLRYEDVGRVDLVVTEIDTMLRSHVDLDQNQRIVAHLTEFSAYALNIDICAFTITTNSIEYRDVQQDVFLKIAKIVEQQGAQMAFPTQSVHFVQNKHLRES